ncbi:MAG: nicotinate phosphoribosyltransferase, partial [Mycobacteriaceae bacterium]
AVRIDSGDLGVMAADARALLDSLGATSTKVVLSGDLDEYAIAGLRAEPVDAYGVGTSLVTGSGAPTAGMVYKLVSVDGVPVAKRSTNKATRGGAKHAVRRARDTGTVVEEFVHRADAAVDLGPHDRALMLAMVRGGEVLEGLPSLAQARDHLAAGLVSLPWEGLKLSKGDPAIPTTFA